jgi:hypothetical protein
MEEGRCNNGRHGKTIRKTPLNHKYFLLSKNSGVERA